MNRTEQNPEAMLDRIIGEIRDERIDDGQVEESSRRVWERVASQGASSGARLSSCSDFQALIAAYQDGTLAPGRRMLLEDHTRNCATCRKILFAEPEAVSNVVELRARPRRMTRTKWMAIAASATVALIAGRWTYEQFAPAPDGSRATVQMAEGSVYRLDKGLLQPVSIGTELDTRQVIRTAAGSRATVKLIDGSIVEVGERGEFSVTAQRRDTTVHLNRGTIIVQAAKRKTGHLYVSSGDSRIAVTGTVFSVNRGAKGTRVSVIEGEVIVERGHNDKVLHAGDQLSTHRSIDHVAIKDEIAWSRNASEHLQTLEAMTNIKESLKNMRMPGIRYNSRLMDFVPANAVFFLSVPNMRDALADAQTLVKGELQRAGAEVPEHKMSEFVDRVGKISEYLGEEFVFAGVRSGREFTGLAIADVHRPGLAQFLEAEKTKSGESKIQIVEGAAPVHSRQKEELLVAIRDNRVVIGMDEALVNAAFAGGSGFPATPFGQRIGQAFRDGTGILLGVDLQSVIRSEVQQPNEQTIVSKLGGDGLRYLIAEQKTFNGNTQHSATLNFNGQRHGLASWLGAPGPMGGLSFVSSRAQFAASVITKNPQEMIEELFALAATKGPDGLAKLQEMERLAGVNIKQDVAASLGSEATIALDGPLVPIPSWKVILEVNNQDRLQQSIEKIVVALNREMQKEGRGITIESHTNEQRERTGIAPAVSTTMKMYTIRLTGEASIPAMHYTYADGYLLAGATEELVWGAIQNRSSGMRLDTSGTFRGLLPTDQNANFSGLIYQNAQETLKLLSNVAPGDQQKVRELAEKIGPTLVAAYAHPDYIQVSTFGSSMDFLMQTALSPAFHGGRKFGPYKHGTPKQTAAYR
jgi:ferric-dicitrate binding protein FerR (iron transport regulator)